MAEQAMVAILGFLVVLFTFVSADKFKLNTLQL